MSHSVTKRYRIYSEDMQFKNNILIFNKLNHNHSEMQHGIGFGLAFSYSYD